MPHHATPCHATQPAQVWRPGCTWCWAQARQRTAGQRDRQLDSRSIGLAIAEQPVSRMAPAPGQLPNLPRSLEQTQETLQVAPAQASCLFRGLLMPGSGPALACPALPWPCITACRLLPIFFFIVNKVCYMLLIYRLNIFKCSPHFFSIKYYIYHC